ncbi:hypothetical protein BDV95DRAFT_45682 [Massariosphaeria phaeospora]|uniref:Uncharacterized protein n=1 Tax=Massariosphaeria phaeospora TaxID=100035 RepID=A0A7C8I5Z0_9PLEO|nr:hypothetical protein BDV95DRAFT_45682 [Massariosphaeria phaeospora]
MPQQVDLKSFAHGWPPIVCCPDGCMGTRPQRRRWHGGDTRDPGAASPVCRSQSCSPTALRRRCSAHSPPSAAFVFLCGDGPPMDTNRRAPAARWVASFPLSAPGRCSRNSALHPLSTFEPLSPVYPLETPLSLFSTAILLAGPVQLPLFCSPARSRTARRPVV